MNADDVAQLKRLFAEHGLDRLHALQRHTNNEIHTWHAYRFARLAQVPIPEWVLEYFDRTSRALTATKGPRSAKAITEAHKKGKTDVGIC